VELVVLPPDPEVAAVELVVLRPPAPVIAPVVELVVPLVNEGVGLALSEQATTTSVPAKATKKEIGVRIFNSSSDACLAPD
jgi:hypothetical protein